MKSKRKEAWQNQAWEMTKGELKQKAIDVGTKEWNKHNPSQDLRYPVENYIKSYENNFFGFHEENIQKSLDEGKIVPNEVLKDYPNLKNTEKIK